VYPCRLLERTLLDSSNTSPEVEASGINTAILPVGAIEQHGPHLPLSVDWAQAEHVSRLVAGRMNAFLLPGVPFGTSEAHDGFRGSISVSHESLKTYVRDICESLIGQGFTRIAILNFHAGNIALKVLVRQVNWAQDSGKVVLMQPWIDASARITEILESSHEEMHAGEMETSIMMHIAPDHVGDERIDHVPNLGSFAFDLSPMKDYAPDGIWGRPSLATAEKGRLVIEAMVDATVDHLEKTFERLGLPGSPGHD